MRRKSEKRRKDKKRKKILSKEKKGGKNVQKLKENEGKKKEKSY